MRIRHTASFGTSKSNIKQLLDDGKIQYKLIDSSFLIVNIYEDNERWSQFENILKNMNELTMCYTEFEKNELEAADWLAIVPEWHHQYPQPEKKFAYMNEVYDLVCSCKECENGKVQKAGFQFKKEPFLKKHDIFQLNWVFDEYFVKKEVYHKVFEPFGIKFWPTYIHKKDTVIENVVQLKIDDISPEPMNMEGYPYKLCSKCGNKKYAPLERGFFPPFCKNFSGSDIFKSQEIILGNGVFREIIISQKLYREIVKNNVKGISFHPLKNI